MEFDHPDAQPSPEQALQSETAYLSMQAKLASRFRRRRTRLLKFFDSKLEKCDRADASPDDQFRLMKELDELVKDFERIEAGILKVFANTSERLATATCADHDIGEASI